jgi:hypothetical protein
MNGGTHTADGNATAISTLFTEPSIRQIDIKAGSANAAVFYVGGSDVTAAGANAFVALEAGTTWGARADVGDRLRIDLTNLYVIGTASDLVHIAVV